jgi:hypothetical protein
MDCSVKSVTTPEAGTPLVKVLADPGIIPGIKAGNVQFRPSVVERAVWRAIRRLVRGQAATYAATIDADARLFDGLG